MEKRSCIYPYIKSLETKKYKIKDLSLGETVKNKSELDFSMYIDGDFYYSIVEVSYMSNEKETVNLKLKTIMN